MNNASGACLAYRRYLFSHSSLALSYYNVSRRTLRTRTSTHSDTEIPVAAADRRLQCYFSGLWFPSQLVGQGEKAPLPQKRLFIWKGPQNTVVLKIKRPVTLVKPTALRNAPHLHLLCGFSGFCYVTIWEPFCGSCPFVHHIPYKGVSEVKRSGRTNRCADP